jgi:hypothetical protein
MTNEIEIKLNRYVRENLTQRPEHTRKIVCLVWFDKLSGRLGTSLELTGLRRIVHETPCDVPYDEKKVIETLVEEFGYKYERAYRRVVPGVQSRKNKREEANK